MEIPRRQLIVHLTEGCIHASEPGGYRCDRPNELRYVLVEWCAGGPGRRRERASDLSAAEVEQTAGICEQLFVDALSQLTFTQSVKHYHQIDFDSYDRGAMSELGEAILEVGGDTVEIVVHVRRDVGPAWKCEMYRLQIDHDGQPCLTPRLY